MVAQGGRQALTPQGYILCYCINRPGALAPYIQEFARRSGLPVVQLCGIRQKVHPKARCILDAGPAEFLELFENAAFVFTNSFHGTVFSTQFRVPFFTAVSPAELADPESSRTFSLLSRLGLSDRIVGQGSTDALETPVDWDAVEPRLLAARAASLEYLRDALENRPFAPEPEAAPPAAATDQPPRLADRGRCTGCTACAAGCPKDAITMVRDSEGFSYPAVDLNACIHCGRCTAICPILRQREPMPLPAAFAAWNADDQIRRHSTSGGALNACIHCGRCTAICPILRQREPMPLPAAFAAWNADDQIRRHSTSGGAFTALAEYILEGGGVVYGAALDGKQHLRHVACFRKEDLWRLRGAKYVQSDALAEYILEGGGVVYGAALDGKQHLRHVACFRKEDLWRLRGAKYVQSDLGQTFRLEGGGVVYGAALDGKQHLRHVACFRKEDLWRLRGAKYVQSDLGQTFREIREALKKRPVLFSGTPCQVDGLYRFLGGKPENLTTCDLVCHGVPSPGVWEDMVRSMERRKGKAIQSVRFRDKVTGWKDSHLTLIYGDGTVDSAPLFATEYGRAFGRALFLRPCCHRCAYTNLNRPGDFTLGDFWGLGPDELPEQQTRGVSLLLVLFLRPCCHRCAYTNLNRPGDFTLGDFWGLGPDELPEQQTRGVSLLLVNSPHPCCHRCAYTNLNRPGDFTLGDFWGLGPDELPEQQTRGVSLLLVNSPHGSYLFDQLPLRRQAFPIERAVAGNPRLAFPLAPPPDRAAFFAAYTLKPFEQVRKQYFKVPPLPVRLAGKALTPEVKAKIRQKLR